jgi:hypothetical protein
MVSSSANTEPTSWRDLHDAGSEGNTGTGPFLEMFMGKLFY